MIGLTIMEVSLLANGSGYRRIAEDDRMKLAAYYSDRYRHALFVRSGVVFDSGANVEPRDVLEAFEAAVRRVREIGTDAERPVDWYAVLGDLAVRKHAYALYSALSRVVDDACPEFWSVSNGVRPAALRRSIETAAGVFRDAQEERREATRPARRFSADERRAITDGSPSASPEAVRRAEEEHDGEG